jgi:hypothetical protein
VCSEGGSNAVILPSWTIEAIAVVPRGARPSYAHGYYQRDNAFYVAWDAISRDREAFQAGCDEHVHGARAEGDRTMTDLPHSAAEMMTVAAARALANDDVCFVGIGLPSAACNLARLTHAPRLKLCTSRARSRRSRMSCRCRLATASSARRR